MATVKVRVLIEGVVQGVGFRYAARRKMEQLGISGRAENLPDGRVESEFEGEKDKVKEMVEWCQEGPPLAHVKRVAVVTKA